MVILNLPCFGQYQQLCTSIVIIAVIDLVPANQTVYEGGTVTYTTVAVTALASMTWTVNNQSLNMLSGIDLETIMLDVGLRQLILSNISIAYNNAIVRCTGVYKTGLTVLCSPEGHLGVQGECKDRDVA